MTIVIMAILLLIAQTLQAGMLPGAALGYATPPFVLGVVLYYALERGRGWAVLAGFAGGFLVDSLSMGIGLGVSSFCFCVAGLAVGRFRHLVFSDSVITSAFFGGICAAAIDLIVLGLLYKDGAVQPSASWVLLKVISTAMLGVICTPLVFIVARKLDSAVGNISVKEEENAEGQPI